jgi:AcrR family transcriptional regulator
MSDRSRRPYAKGISTREEILDRALPILNERGLETTYDELVLALGVSKGRITHHFPTKETLVQALSDRCGEALDEAGRLPEGPWTLSDVADSFRRSLDVIHTYRVIYIASMTATTPGSMLHEKARMTFAHRMSSVRPFLQVLVQLGILEENILDQRHCDAATAALVMSFIAWPIYRQNAVAHLSQSFSRSVALRSCMLTLMPYLTEKAHKDFDALFATL